MFSRRDFLGAAAIATAARPILGANDRVNVAVIGIGGRGRDHVNSYSKIADARISALCDVDQSALERAQAQVQRLGGGSPKGYPDMRKVFEDKDVDAVSMPLPNHWHALATIWACQAGKHVYVEKPACHNVWEGQRMIDAARKYKRCVQIGSQSRSIPYIQRAAKLLADGTIGQLYMAKGLCFKRRKSIGHKPDGPVPPGVDWDKFLGPAPMRAFNENRFKYNWHWFWDTGNGDLGNQGVHQVDIARWGLGLGLPNWVVSTGGKYVYDDDQETPNTQFATFGYDGNKEITFEVRGLLTGDEGGIRRDGPNVIGDLFYGSEGWMALDGHGLQVHKGEKNEKVLDEPATRGGSDTVDHMQNFVAAIRANDPSKLTAPVEVGVESAVLCHLANISYRVGRRLDFDPKTWTFKNDAEANRLLTREYRAPYVVPEKV